jgi:galactokinase
VELAQIGQYAENVFFGKPCGLMDQTASSVGGVVAIDFADTEHPVVEQISLDLTAHGYALCILDSGAGHADLTGEYAAITDELKTVCGYFGKEVLRDVPEDTFLAALPQVRQAAGDRAVLRALHVYDENRRAADEAQALREDDFDKFLSLVRQSGQSSALYLQNVVPLGQSAHQELLLTIALCERILAGRGAVRVHGGGFGGTAQAFVPLDLLDTFKAKTEAVLGQGSCHVVTIRPVGGVQIV